MRIRITKVALCAVVGLAACGTDPAAFQPAPSADSDLPNLVVDDEQFSFATTRAVTLDVSGPGIPDGEVAPIQVLDASGQTVFRGVVLSGRSQTLRLSLALVDDRLSVVSGDSAHEVVLVADRGELQL